MMDKHDPYPLILDELNELNDVDDENEFRSFLVNTRPYVQKLRQGYRTSPNTVDYSCTYQRAAYLLAYYPHYIEALFRVLKEYVPEQQMQEILCDTKQKACFLGAGPAPEVLGWLAYLREKAPSITRAVAYLVDNADWYNGQTLTTYHLAPKYWNGSLRSFRIPLNLADPHPNLPPVLERAITRSKLIVMQNCLTEFTEQAESFLENFERIINASKPGTLFVIIDINCRHSRERMQEIELLARRSNCSILCEVGQGSRTFYSQISIPNIVTDELLTGQEDLIPKTHTEFVRSVFVRYEDELSNIPF